MKKINLIRYVSMLMITAALFNSCIDKDYDLKDVDTSGALTPTLGLPVGAIKYDIQSILRIAGANDQIKIENDSIFIIYNTNFQLTSDNSVELPESFSYPVIPLEVSPESVAGTEFTVSSGVDIDAIIQKPTQTRIDSISLLNSRIKVTVTNTSSESTEFELVMPSGIELASTPVFTLTPGETITQTYSVQDGSILKLSGNVFNVTYKVRRASDFTFNPLETTVVFGFDNLDADILWGFFGDVSFEDKEDRIRVNLFDDIVPKNSTLRFHNPMIKCEVLNYVGMNAKFTIISAEAIGKDANGNPASEKAEFAAGESYEVSVPAAPQAHAYSSTVQIFDRNNGAINKMFELYQPQYVEFKFKTDPSVNASTEQHFLLKDQYMDVSLDVRLPFSFDQGTTLVTSDTLEFIDLMSEEEDMSDNLNFMKIRINYENHLPLYAQMDILFLDENKQEIAGLGKDFTVSPADTDSQGNALKSSETMLHFYFDKDKWNDLTRTKYVLLNNKLYTDPSIPQTIKINPDDFIRFKIDVFGKINFEF